MLFDINNKRLHFKILYLKTNLTLLIVLFMTVKWAGSECCYSKTFANSIPKCGDGTFVKSFYCGVGSCNIFGCNCEGGCRTTNHHRLHHRHHHGHGHNQHHHRHLNTDSKSLRFDAGDIIVCEMIGIWMDFHTYLTSRSLFHVMLAINSSEVIHINVIDNNRIDRVEIVKESFDDARNGKTHCHIETNYFNSQVQHYWGLEPLSNDIAIRRAEAYEAINHSKYVSYDVIDKNCEHWITFWKYGLGFNLQVHPGQPKRQLLKWLGVKPSISPSDNFEGSSQITWNGYIRMNPSPKPSPRKPKLYGICWKHLDCYSKSCNFQVGGREFGYCEKLTLA